MKLPNWLSRFRSEGGTPPPSDDFWYTDNPGSKVSAETAKQLSAVMACVRCISEDVASVPLLIYKRMENGGKQRANTHPLYNVLHDAPNKWQTAMEWREMMQAHVELRGNAYSQIVPGPRGFADQLIPLHPDKVRPMKDAATGIIKNYEVTNPDGTKRYLLPDEVFHLRGLSSDGIVGESPISWAANTVCGGLDAQDFANQFWRNSAQPGGVLEHPGKLSDMAAKRLKDSFQKRYTGAGRHSVAVLEEGMKYNKLGITMVEAQFLEHRKFTRSEIAGLYRVPPHKIGDLDKASFSNIEQQSIDYVVSCLRPRMVRWEQAISRDLIIQTNAFFAEHLIDGLLRGDIQSRYTAYNMARWWMTGDEIRMRENLNPIGLDKPLQPLNETPAGEQPKQDPNKQDNPPAKASLETPATEVIQ